MFIIRNGNNLSNAKYGTGSQESQHQLMWSFSTVTGWGLGKGKGRSPEMPRTKRQSAI